MRFHLVGALVAVCLAVSQSFAVTYTAPIINRFGQVGLFHTQSAMTLGMGRLHVGAYGNISLDSKYIHSIVDAASGDTLKKVGDTLEHHIPGLQTFNLDLALGYGIARFLDFSAMMPVYFDRVTGERYYTSGGGEVGDLGGSAGGFGDMELALKFQYPPYPHKRFFEMAYYGAVSVPTGSRKQGFFPRHAYYVKDTSGTIGDVGDLVAAYTSRGAEIDMKMLWTFDLAQLRLASPVLVHVNYGARWNLAGLDHLFLLNLAFEYHPVEWFGMFTEFSGETRISNVERGFKIGDDPLRLSPGISFTPPGGLHFTIGADINLSSDTALLRYELDNKSASGKVFATRMEPRWRLCGTIGWAGYILPQDADEDGIKDADDRCPQDPEDLDGFEDTDGCPDPDNDKDGVVDLKDKCPNDAEDLDGFEDEDGCPDTDNDNDRVPDSLDQCPLVPEDLDDFEDKDGCPDTDNDKDGIPDSVDHCLTLPEDKDGFQDNDGCPDVDNDLDEVPDSIDRCPDTPGEKDNEGCPKEKARAKEMKRGRVILRGVNFKFGSAILTGDSYAILDRVYQSLVEWPEIQIEIRGHTDSIGSRIANKRLSRKRAESVSNYLISKGISPERLRAEGMGEDEPIAENATAEGRAMNRRVELHRID
ncbi:MAG: OmpA family protein [Chitinivibrionales bacterium]|nr:OmpA family protein [Chitinivibrionales bacterium]MBD3394127.1 OmpA family protein [Chitinivibrionales bacterium]